MNIFYFFKKGAKMEIKTKKTYFIFSKIEIEKLFKKKGHIIIPATLLKIVNTNNSIRTEILFSSVTGKVKKIDEWIGKNKKNIYFNKFSDELNELEKIEDKCLIFKGKLDFKNFEYNSMTSSKDVHSYGELLIFENEKFFNLLNINEQGLQYLI